MNSLTKLMLAFSHSKHSDDFTTENNRATPTTKTYDNDVTPQTSCPSAQETKIKPPKVTSSANRRRRKRRPSVSSSTYILMILLICGLYDSGGPGLLSGVGAQDPCLATVPYSTPAVLPDVSFTVLTETITAPLVISNTHADSMSDPLACGGYNYQLINVSNQWYFNEDLNAD